MWPQEDGKRISRRTESTCLWANSHGSHIRWARFARRSHLRFGLLSIQHCCDAAHLSEIRTRQVAAPDGIGPPQCKEPTALFAPARQQLQNDLPYEPVQNERPQIHVHPKPVLDLVVGKFGRTLASEVFDRAVGNAVGYFRGSS